MSERFEDDIPRSLDDVRDAANEMGINPYPEDSEGIIELIDKVYYAARDKRQQKQGDESGA